MGLPESIERFYVPDWDGHFQMYDDTYPTCEETYITLRIYPGAVDPDLVSEALLLRPTRIQRRGDMASFGIVSSVNAWTLSSRNVIPSRDARRHLDWMLDQISSKRDDFDLLRTRGARVELCCTWHSARGHGGPTLSSGQMRELAKLGLDCWFDVYFIGEREIESEA